jgi:hypothetical protein
MISLTLWCMTAQQKFCPFTMTAQLGNVGCQAVLLLVEKYVEGEISVMLS